MRHSFYLRKFNKLEVENYREREKINKWNDHAERKRHRRGKGEVEERGKNCLKLNGRKRLNVKQSEIF